MRERHRFLLFGYVVMPEHVHLLISESAKSSPSVVLKALKQCVSRELNSAGRLPRFWQPRFYDFNVWSSKKLKEKLEYMHSNPVKRGLVKSPGDWIWSSFLFYEKGESGLVIVDPLD
jgi:putative transposase